MTMLETIVKKERRWNETRSSINIFAN